MERMNAGLIQSLYNIMVFACFVWMIHQYLTPKYQRRSILISLAILLCLILLFNLYLHDASVALRNIIFLSCILLPFYLIYKDSILWKTFVILSSFGFMILPEVIFDFFCYFIFHTTTPEVLTTTSYGWFLLFVISLIPFFCLIYMKNHIIYLCQHINHQRLFIIMMFVISTILLPSLCILSLSSTSIICFFICCTIVCHSSMVHQFYYYCLQKKQHEFRKSQQECYKNYLMQYEQYTKTQQAQLRHELGNILTTIHTIKAQKERDSI